MKKSKLFPAYEKQNKPMWNNNVVFTLKIIVFLLIAIETSGQNKKGGVYLTYQDYINNKLNYEINCKTDKESLKVNEFINEPYITLLDNKRKIKLYKDSIYAFKPCNEALIRFQNNKQYRLSESGTIWIYYREVEEKNKAEENPYHYPVSKAYYFSIGGNEKILPLNTDSVKLAFQTNQKIQSMISKNFNNTTISEYDVSHKMFKVNYFLKQTVNGK